MSHIPQDLMYTKEHEWLKVEGDSVVLGITDHAQDALGDLVFIELPEIGQKVEKDGIVAVVESVKAASEVYSPFAGDVVAANSELETAPECLNTAPYESWIAKLIPENMQDVRDASMTVEEYAAFVAS